MTREEWLEFAVDELKLKHGLNWSGYKVPPIRVSTGFTGSRNGNKALGSCWNGKAADDGKAQIFISPILNDSVKVLEVLGHEMIHAVHPTAGHKGKFRETALAMGLIGPMTATVAGPALLIKLQRIADKLGKYPHAKLNPAESGLKKQTTRLILVQCEPCEYKARVSNTTLERCGAPLCGSCLERMEVKS